MTRRAGDGIAADRGPVWLPVSVPLTRLVVCLDCEWVTEVGEHKCPNCSGRTLWLLSRWLERASREANDA